jgi:hypothetical protein
MIGAIAAIGPWLLCLSKVRIKKNSMNALNAAPRIMATGSAIQKLPVRETNSYPKYAERRAIPPCAKFTTRVERQTKTIEIAINA